ncbi:MAG: hypothetical protein HY980_01930 [Candidatus Magasanikbacteria bacterium]|nr:hypothetical protein [Candidatus Magasanikbacteria bacterium]
MKCQKCGIELTDDTMCCEGSGCCQACCSCNEPAKECGDECGGDCGCGEEDKEE